jgi:acetyl-CoA carboxylase biotin carboxylase subunit
MFSKILIANRGEIACRIIQTCKRLGIATVAVYSDADANSLHVRMADEARRIGGPEARESYLNVPAIVDAALATGAEAVHPGYGFLSEKPDLPRALEQAGVAFIGPKASVIEEMGNKLRARRLAEQAGLPLNTASQDILTAEQAHKFAREVGYPILVKPSNGGGGIGSVVVRSGDQLEEGLRQARSIAQRAFASDSLYLERFLEGVAHIEAQVLADHHGRVLHLFERECSVQRRNQKVIEETPSPKLSQFQRMSLYNSAVALARHIGYTNAGTIEFLLDQQGQLYFLEMNTRLQVEHRVTELTTGLDIVEWQVRIACGQKLPWLQEDIHRQGHAIEARVYAEDPDTFFPSTGTVEGLNLPSGRDVVVDTLLFEGYQVPIFYDPLLAKVVVWSERRNDAINGLRRALRSTIIKGPRTNIPALLQVLDHAAFRDGSYTTQLLRAMRQGDATPTLENPWRELMELMHAYGR